MFKNYLPMKELSGFQVLQQGTGAEYERQVLSTFLPLLDTQ